MAAARRQDGSRRLSGDDLIVEIAWKYYHDGLNQGEIADLLDVSRSTVVNHLQEARLRDYVRVSLRPSIFERHRLAAQLCDRFGLKVKEVPVIWRNSDRSTVNVLGAPPKMLLDLARVRWRFRRGLYNP